MAWLQLRINSTAEQAENLSGHLEKLGAVSVTFMDSFDTPIFEPQIGETRLWRDSDVMALFDADTNMQPIIETLKQANFLTDQAYKIEQIEDKDWIREWMNSFQPMQFGKHLWICPSWREVADPKAVNVMLDPGLAFGTGTHPTTSLCLNWLDSLVDTQNIANKTIIDFGCGSGILAISALKLGFKHAIGIDIDSQAVLASQNNAQQNQVAEKLELFLAEQTPKTLKADIVIANILAGPLQELYPTIDKLLNSQGKLCLSGILTTQAQRVANTYAQSFKIEEIIEKEEWCRIVATKL